MKKIILLVFICVFCFGCKARYELQINEDLTVNENITGLETDTFYNQYYKSTKERVINSIMYMDNEYLNNVGYSKKIVNEDNLTGATVNKKFNSLEEYFELSKAYTQFYENFDYKINNGVVTIDLKDQLLINYDSIERYAIDSCDVVITLPFKVKKSNADYINKETNTYIWNLNGDSQKDIYIKFDTKMGADLKDNSISIISFVIVGIAVIVITGIIYFIYDKNKKSNEI